MKLSYDLGVRINGDKISDEGAKIIALLLRGALRYEIANATFIKKKDIYTIVCDLYGYLGIESQLNVLLHDAVKSGFDYQFKYLGKDIFTPAELARVYEKIPRFQNETTEVIVTLHAIG